MKGFGKSPLPSILQQAQQALVQGDLATAEIRLAQALQGDRLSAPEQGSVHDLQGLISQARGNLTGSMVQFQQAIICQPQSAPFHAHLGILLRQMGERERAMAMLERAIKLDPTQVDAHSTLGDIRQAQGAFDEAIKHYLAALERAAGDPDIPYQLGLCLWKLERTEDAVPWFERVLSLDPDHVDAKYLLSVLQVLPAPDKTPPQWITRLFDDYAPLFDDHLVHKLGYRGHEALWQLVGQQGRRFANALDLGCGTGLVGSLFRPQVDHLVGVDLSARMLQQAQAKGIYDQLLQMDMLELLGAADQSYDLILAGDVFIYMGDLTDSLRACSQALHPGGILAFTTEALSVGSRPYSLGSRTGRFAHRPDYVRGLGAELGLQEEVSDPFVLRQEGTDPVQGYAWCWRQVD